MMVGITEIPHRQWLHVMGSDRYSVRNAHVFDDVANRFIASDDIEIMEDR
jgi:hypothetical protein